MSCCRLAGVRKNSSVLCAEVEGAILFVSGDFVGNIARILPPLVTEENGLVDFSTDLIGCTFVGMDSLDITRQDS